MSLIKTKVVDENLLLEGLHKHELHKADESKAEYKLDETNDIINLIPNATILLLSFKNISKIENLVGFTKLTKLCLDNNNIETITNLSLLVNLTWLDLSFNKIKKIEGLNNLINLEDLSLFNNLITVIEGLDNCKKLKCLSIGNNQISNINDTILLRRIPSLRILTLAGNPICKDSDYKKKVIVYFNRIQYLDYLLIDNNERIKNIEGYNSDLLLLEKDDNIYKEQELIKLNLSNEIIKLQNVRIYYTYTLFSDLFSDDKPMRRLQNLPGTNEQINRFEIALKTINNEFISNAYERYNTQQQAIDKYTLACQSLSNNTTHDRNSLVNGLLASLNIIEELIHIPHTILPGPASTTTTTTTTSTTTNGASSVVVRPVPTEPVGSGEGSVTYSVFHRQVQELVKEYEKVRYMHILHPL